MNNNVKKSEPRHFFGIECAEPKYYSKTGELEGYVEIEIECLTKLHIGSGSYLKYGNSLSKAVMRYDGEPVIPGSSLKGCIRAIAAAVSHSCLRDIDFKNKYNQDRFKNDKFKCSPKEKCIVCSAFGTMGYASRVDFSEMLPIGKCSAVTIQKKKPFNPKYPINNSRKFYKSDIKTKPRTDFASGNNSDQDTINIEAVREGAKFGGKIFFRKLTEEQLGLLMFALGFDESFAPLIGGFRFDGLGKVKITALNYQYGLNKTPKQLAEEYAASTDCKTQILQLRNKGFSGL